MAKTVLPPCVAEAHFAVAAVNINKKIVFGMIQLFVKKKKKERKEKRKQRSKFTLLQNRSKNRSLKAFAHKIL